MTAPLPQGTIDARALLLEATTGDRCLLQAPQVLAIRIENTYEQGGEEFWVDARMNWSTEPCTLTIDNAVEAQADYDIQSYFAHRHRKGATVATGMHSGHYVSYFKHAGSWSLADDEKVRRLAEPPTEFPYLVFLARSDRQAGVHMKSLEKRFRRVQAQGQYSNRD